MERYIEVFDIPSQYGKIMKNMHNNITIMILVYYCCSIEVNIS